MPKGLLSRIRRKLRICEIFRVEPTGWPNRDSRQGMNEAAQFCDMQATLDTLLPYYGGVMASDVLLDEWRARV